MAAAILAFPTPAGPLRERVAPSARSVLSDGQRKAAQERLMLIQPMVNAVLRGASVRSAVAAIHSRAPEMFPSQTTLRGWVECYIDGGLDALATQYTGRVRQASGWELRATQLFAQPQQPAYSTVAYWLQQEGFAAGVKFKTFAKRVTRYLQSLPSNVAETSPKRLGEHYYSQNVRKFTRRDTTVLKPGECWEGDGHCCDVYVQHPTTAEHFRPELTVWIDVRSQYVAGWWLGERENSVDVLFALSSGIRAHDLVPVMVHHDPGAGYTAKMLSDEALGFYARLSITPVKTIAGNAKGKGMTEGWFRWYEERLGKRFTTFCGDSRTDDALSRLRERIKRGELSPPTFQQYLDAVKAYIQTYNNTAKDTLGGSTPAQLWAQRITNPAHCHEAALLRPRREASVRRWEVRLFNRFYRHADLAQHEGRRVVVEYELHDDAHVWIRDARGRFVCEALLVEKTAWAKDNVLADRRAKSLQGQEQRLQSQLDEHRARSVVPISAAAMLDALEQELPTAQPSAASELMSQGHGFRLPAPAKARVPKPISAAAQREVEARIDDELLHCSPIPGNSHDRFALWREVEAAQARGEAPPAELAEWFASYPNSSEHRAHALVLEQFPD